MKHIPKGAKVYIVTIVVIGSFLLLYSIFFGKFSAQSLQAIALFGILMILTETMTVSLPRGGYLSVGFALEYAMLLLYDPSVTIVVSMVGALVGTLKVIKANPLRVMFNISQFFISVYMAGFVFYLLGGQFGQIVLEKPAPLIAMALTYWVTNATLVTVIVSLSQGFSPWGTWASNIKWSIPNMLALAPMGLLMAYLYHPPGSAEVHPIRVLFFFVPLLIARYSFKLYMDMRDIHRDTVTALIGAIEAKDHYTRGHSERVAKISLELGKRIGLGEEEMEDLEYSALLHDIGKIGVKEDILNKPGRLTDEEFVNIKEHPVLGSSIVARMETFEALTKVIRAHHERFEGGGYPDGLAREKIPLLSRIIAVADTFDAMTSERPYRPPIETGTAVLEIGKVAGAQLDPDVVAVFLEMYAHEIGRKEPLSFLEAAASSDS